MSAEIVWAVTAAGKRMPVDAQPNPDGNLVLAPAASPGQPPTAYVAPAPILLLGGSTPRMDRYTSHFATCPNAAQHRRPR
jgi:hypothetical protein